MFCCALVLGVIGCNDLNTSDDNPAWSPDGTQILFDSDRGGNRDLYVIKADGTDMRRITSNTAMDINPSWR